MKGNGMILSLETWILPAVTAGSSSYLVCLLWERIKHATAPSGRMSSFLSVLSFLMGAIYTYYTRQLFASDLEINIIIMFAAGAISTYLWLLSRKYFPWFNKRSNT
jgi:hypothetical protein